MIKDLKKTDIFIISIIIISIIIFSIRLIYIYNGSLPQSKSVKVTFEVTSINEKNIDKLKIGDNIYQYDKNILIGKIDKIEVRELKRLVTVNNQEIEMSVEGYKTLLIEVEANAIQGNGKTIINKGIETYENATINIFNNNIFIESKVLRIEGK